MQWTARSAFGSHEQAWQDVFQERLKEFPTVFPIQSQSIETMIVTDGSTHQTENRPWAGLRLESADKKWIVKTDYQGVVLSRLRPYCGWEEFVAQGLKVWEAYRMCAEPIEIQRLSVRAINVIEVESFRQVRDFLQHPPECLDDADLPASGFMYQSLHLALSGECCQDDSTKEPRCEWQRNSDCRHRRNDYGTAPRARQFPVPFACSKMVEGQDFL